MGIPACPLHWMNEWMKNCYFFFLQLLIVFLCLNVFVGKWCHHKNRLVVWPKIYENHPIFIWWLYRSGKSPVQSRRLRFYCGVSSFSGLLAWWARPEKAICWQNNHFFKTKKINFGKHVTASKIWELLVQWINKSTLFNEGDT